MKLRRSVVQGLMMFCLLGAGLLKADILLVSTASLPVCLYNADATQCTAVAGGSVATNPHPLWEPNHPANPGQATDTSAVWISYADTGYLGSYFQAEKDTIPVFNWTEYFSTVGNATLYLKVWADDTARIILDGNVIKDPVFTQSICSGQPIGCQPNDFQYFNYSLAAGTHTLGIDTYQVGSGTDTGSNPMGLLFTGSVNGQVTVPEPTALLLTVLMASLVFAGTSILRKRA